MKKILWSLAIIVTVFVIALIGGSFYMLDFSLAPDPNRMDTDSCYRQQFEKYPESKEWVDSLRSIGALRDTFSCTLVAKAKAMPSRWDGRTGLMYFIG